MIAYTYQLKIFKFNIKILKQLNLHVALAGEAGLAAAELGDGGAGSSWAVAAAAAAAALPGKASACAAATAAAVAGKCGPGSPVECCSAYWCW